MEIEALPGTQCRAGEGIVWCSRRQCLFWVDIAGRAIIRRDPETGVNQRWDLPAQPGCIALTTEDRLIVALPDGLHLFDPRHGSLVLLAGLPADAPAGHRANDGAVSRSGRFVFGTMPLEDRSRPSGSLYYWADGEVRRHFGGLHIVNGLAFSSDDRTAYMSDSYELVRTVWAFDHDPDTGALHNRREFFRTHGIEGRPDGATVDADDCYWMAGVGGGELLRITPSGVVDMRIAVPVTWPSKPCFGGPDLKTIFLTSLRPSGAVGEFDGQVIQIQSPFQGLEEPYCTTT